MTVLVDPPLWRAHERLWSHLASDTSLEELHAFAGRAGIPRRSFEGDHYDIPQERYADVVAAGAVEVSGGELARRLRASGLRFRKRRGERPLARVVDGLPQVVPGPHVLEVVGSPHERRGAGAAVVLIASTEPQPRMVLVRNASREGWGAPGGKRETTDGSVRATAVREVAEEIGLRLDPEVLVPVGYQRITIAAGHGRGTWDDGDNYVQVYAATLPSPVPLRPDGVEVLEARWLSLAEARGVAGQAAWWPLAEWWWARG
ncbi:hypothetical protein SGUI_2741 [Serinicoccus hydrothermalis]|uniref:Nudix hydrolase domain-containing protein n=1 Tax=Serinicoccus hydrothermalis TaxID=1758689 RepID=A0A1B1NFB5_9MICO|nr:DUF4031 domain-containing protein [Serinicoccus hydrothermalis]ANS80137.1 hypothetical protein SGUI_2741 [Serinicoccus hydrothermalis]